MLARIALALCLSLATLAAVAGSYTFGVVPQFEQRKLFAIWQPVLDELSRRTGHEFRFAATLGVPEFERGLAAGSFDFVYANPYQILRESSHQGYVPLVRDREPLRGILVVRKDSPLTSPAELDGKPLAVPSPNALGASLLLRLELEQLFRARVQPLDVKTHTSVYLHVVNGLVPAGGGVEKTLREQAPAIRNALRILHVTQGLPSHPVAAHPRVPESVRLQVQKAFLDMAGSKAGRALLGDIPIADAVPASIADYRPMAGLGLGKFWMD